MQSSPPLWPWRDDTNALSLYMLEESHVIAKRRQEKQKNIKSTIFLEKVERVFIFYYKTMNQILVFQKH